MTEKQFNEWVDSAKEFMTLKCHRGVMKNDRETRSRICKIFEAFGELAGGKTMELGVICDETNNPPSIIELGAISYCIRAQQFETARTWVDRRIIRISDGKDVVVVPSTYKLEALEEHSIDLQHNQEIVSTDGDQPSKPEKLVEFIGKTEVPYPFKNSPFAHFVRNNWVLHWIERYKGIDGEHHKHWLIDQIVRLVCGQEVVLYKVQRGDNEVEWSVTLHPEVPPKYKKWVDEMNDDPNYEPYTTGTAP